MGVDFIRKAAKNFKKSLDRSRAKLNTPDLFSNEPDCEPRSYTANIATGVGLQSGAEVTVSLEEGEVIARRGRKKVAEFSSPTEELREALKDSHGVAAGTVEDVYDIANTAEISVC